MPRSFDPPKDYSEHESPRMKDRSRYLTSVTYNNSHKLGFIPSLSQNKWALITFLELVVEKFDLVSHVVWEPRWSTLQLKTTRHWPDITPSPRPPETAALGVRPSEEPISENVLR
jgi:hypothetical protein